MGRRVQSTISARRVVHAATALAALLVWAALAAQQAEAAAVTLATGQMVDGAGAPVSGRVTAYAWPQKDPGRLLTVAAEATSDVAGNYVLVAQDGARLQRLAARTGGWLDFFVEGRERVDRR